MEELAAQIYSFRAEGKTYEEIVELLVKNGQNRDNIYLALEYLAQTRHGLAPPRNNRKISGPLLSGFLTTLFILIVAPVIFIFYSQSRPKLLQAATPVLNSSFNVPQVTVAPTPKDSTRTSPNTGPAATLAAVVHPPLKKSTYKIALFGDSMIDTMGDRMDLLNLALNKKYPKVNFKLFNYGIGAENVDTGLARFSLAYSYKDRQYPPISKLGADVIILGSFAYNPFVPYDRNHHWLSLAELIDRAKATGADVYILAEIAPLTTNFGRGPNGVNWPADQASKQSSEIVEQLENAVGLANEKGVGLINAFAQSETESSAGNPDYVSTIDGIHPSSKGQSFTADSIAQRLILK